MIPEERTDPLGIWGAEPGSTPILLSVPNHAAPPDELGIWESKPEKLATLTVIHGEGNSDPDPYQRPRPESLWWKGSTLTFTIALLAFTMGAAIGNYSKPAATAWPELAIGNLGSEPDAPNRVAQAAPSKRHEARDHDVKVLGSRIHKHHQNSTHRARPAAGTQRYTYVVAAAPAANTRSTGSVRLLSRSGDDDVRLLHNDNHSSSKPATTRSAAPPAHQPTSEPTQPESNSTGSHNGSNNDDSRDTDNDPPSDSTADEPEANDPSADSSAEAPGNSENAPGHNKAPKN